MEHYETTPGQDESKEYKAVIEALKNNEYGPYTNLVAQWEEESTGDLESRVSLEIRKCMLLAAAKNPDLIEFIKDNLDAAYEQAMQEGNDALVQKIADAEGTISSMLSE